MADLKLSTLKSTGGVIRLLWSEHSLIITPTTVEVKNLLKLTQKVMAQDEDQPWVSTSKKTTHPLYTEITQEVMLNPNPGELLYEPMRAKVPALWTHHGFADDVVAFLREQGAPYEVIDARLPKPAPDFRRMRGFRFSQQALLETALKQRRSGLIGAPTRFGKSTLILNTCRAYKGLRILVVVPGRDLVKQTFEMLRDCLKEDSMEVIRIGNAKGDVEDDVVTYSAKNLSRDVNVCSMDSLHKVDASMIDLVLVDEPHALPTDGRMPDFVRFDKALKIGYGATLEGRFDGRDPMIKGLIGPVLAERTYQEAVAEGAIAPLTILMVEIPLKFKSAWNRATAYKRALWESPVMEQFLPWLLGGHDRNGRPVLPPEWQVLSFINNEKQVDFIQAIMNRHGIPHAVAMDKLLTGKERDRLMEDMAAGKIRLAFATGIWAQGVTFSNLRVMMNLAGGGCSTSTIQKPGRVAEVIPGKKCGIIVDFNFVADQAELGKAKSSRVKGESCFQPVWESQSRMRYYKAKGFNVVEVRGYDSMVAALHQHCL